VTILLHPPATSAAVAARAAGDSLNAGPPATSTTVVARVMAAAPGAVDWRDEALCARTDPEAFFPGKGASPRMARQVCGRCPVRDACLEFALATDQRYGIWGGRSARERRGLKPTTTATPGMEV
jgi:WhiB family redox-sensing transcriptional regulator